MEIFTFKMYMLLAKIESKYVQCFPKDFMRLYGPSREKFVHFEVK